MAILKITAQEHPENVVRGTATQVDLGVGEARDISIDASSEDVVSQQRVGDDLILELVNGETITIENFFADVDGAARHRLFLNDDGAMTQFGTDGSVPATEIASELVFAETAAFAVPPIGLAIGALAGLGAAAAMAGGSDSSSSDGDTTASAAPVVVVTPNEDGTLSVSGTGEEGAVVMVTFPDGTTGTAAVAGGAYGPVTSLTAQVSGDVTASQEDDTGNTSPTTTEAYAVVSGTDEADIMDAGYGDGTEITNGDDIIYGGGGGDVITPGFGNDVIFGGAGNDTIDISDAVTSLGSGQHQFEAFKANVNFSTGSDFGGGTWGDFTFTSDPVEILVTDPDDPVLSGDDINNERPDDSTQTVNIAGVEYTVAYDFSIGLQDSAGNAYTFMVLDVDLNQNDVFISTDGTSNEDGTFLVQISGPKVPLNEVLTYTPNSLTQDQTFEYADLSTIVSDGNVVHGSADDDTIIIDVHNINAIESGITTIDGGDGADQLNIEGADVILDFNNIDASTITNIEEISLTGIGNNTLTLTLQDLVDLSSSTDELIVLGDAGDIVNAAGFVDTGADQTIGADTYDVYTSGAATLIVDQDITTVIS